MTVNPDHPVGYGTATEQAGVSAGVLAGWATYLQRIVAFVFGYGRRVLRIFQRSYCLRFVGYLVHFRGDLVGWWVLMIFGIFTIYILRGFVVGMFCLWVTIIQSYYE